MSDEDFALEQPPVSIPSVGGLFHDETLATAPLRLAAVEAMLGTLTRNLDFQEFMREILGVAMKAIKAEAGSILEVNHAENTLFFRAVVGSSSDRVADFVIPLGQGIVGHVAESRLPLIVANAEENKQHLRSISSAVGFETHSILCVPIVIRGKVFGVIELLNRIGEVGFGEPDKELLTYVAEVASKVIEIRMMLGWALASRNKEAA